LSRMGSRVRVPYAPLLKNATLEKALIPNGIRAFLFEVKQNITFLRSMPGANSVAFLSGV
ncbi:hypothetical protein, partial [Bacteroides caecimuris]